MPSEIIFHLTLFIISIPLILKSSDVFIEGASKLAKMLGVSDLIIGITLVAFGTSLPELASDSYASYIDHGHIVTGDIIGSNITNMALVFGLTCIIRPLIIKHTELYNGRIHLFILTAASTFIIVAGGINRIAGGLFIICYFLYLWHLIKTYRELGVETVGKDGFVKNLFAVLLGLTGILVSSRILVDSIIGLSGSLNISEYLISLLLMSIGTSLPELFVSVSAAKKGYMTMALGNIIGSNVANMLWIFGVAAVIRPIIIDPGLILVQIFFMLLLSVLVIIFKKSGYIIDRKEGGIFLGIYGIFILTSIVFGDL